MEQKVFSKEEMFSYNEFRKKVFGFSTIIGVAVLVLIFLYYYFFLRTSDFVAIQALNSFFSHIFTNVYGGTLLGVFYAATIGGLFFIFLPMEALFIGFISGYSPFLITLLYIIGFTISYTINYYFGLKFADFAKKIISPKKFYKIKGLINKYGAIIIFGFHAIPFMPSQPLSTLLGVFRYNKTKFYLLFFSGQIIKYLFISLTLPYFKWENLI